MDERSGSRNIFLYRLYVVFNEPLLWGPILIISMQQLAHMDLQQIYYQESVMLFACFLLDVPSGALADMIGRKKTILLGRIFLFISMCFFTFMTAPIHVWIGNGLWAIGYTLQSGADSALLYDTLKEHGKESQYKKIEGSAIGSRLILVACCSLLTGYLASFDLRLPLIIGLPFILIPLIAAFYLSEPIKTTGFDTKRHLNILKESFLLCKSSVSIQWITLFAALVGTVAQVWFFSYNPYFELVSIPIAEYGIIFFCLNVIAWLSSHFADRMEKTLGEQRCVILMLGCVSAPILLMALFPIHPFAYLVMMGNVARGFMRPFVGDYMNRHIPSNLRATLLSIQSSVSYFTMIIALAVFGFLTDKMTLPHAMMILGGSSLVFGLLIYRMYIKKIA